MRRLAGNQEYYVRRGEAPQVTQERLLLGCVHVPYDRGLAGHSDGDAVVHALCDALLGAAGLGDMGHHFPSSAERWRDTPGSEFLVAVAVMLRERDLRVVSAQVVVVADDFGEMFRRLRQIEPDPSKTISVEASRDYDEVHEIWGQH